MGTHRPLLPFASVLFLLLLPFSSLPLKAQQADLRGDDALTEAAEHAVKIASSSSANQALTTRRRKDLEQLLWNLDESKPMGNIYFFEMQPASQTDSTAPSSWVIAVARSARGVYQLYSFARAEGADTAGSADSTYAGGNDAPLREFNRLISQLQLSIPQEKAASFAKLFLESCGPGERNEIVPDADGVSLRLAVENDYMAAYGDIWRALGAYSLWWQGFQNTAPDLEPTAGTNQTGSYRVAVKRLVMTRGRDPQLQNLQLEISPEGKISMLAIKAIFPKHPSWLFYLAPREMPPDLTQYPAETSGD